MKKSNKIIMAGMIALQTMSALASPALTLEGFDTPKAEYTQNKKQNENTDLEMKNKEEGVVYFKNLNTGAEMTLADLMEHNVAGVYENPFEEDKLMVISFQNEDNLRSQHRENQKTLEERQLFDSGSYERHRQQELTKKHTKTGSFHSMSRYNEIDYNFISFSQNQLEKIQDSAKDYSQELKDILPLAIMLHEIAHTHDNQSKQYHELQEHLMNLPEKEIEDLEDKIKRKNELMDLGGENYADSYMFLELTKSLKTSNPENAQELINELANYFINDFRADGEKQDDFEPHASKATVKTTSDFINENWEIIEQFNSNEMKQLSASIVNGTLNNPEINSHINNKKSQQLLAKKGGLSEMQIEIVSNAVNDKLNKMLSVSLNEEGKPELDFSYVKNAHDEDNNKSTRSHRR
jgi:hypothetical protein